MFEDDFVEFKTMAITEYQNIFNYSDKEIAEICNLTEKRFKEIMKDPNSITVLELYNISLGIETNMEFLLGHLLFDINLCKYIENIEELKDIINTKQVKELVSLINNDFLKYDDGYKLIIKGNKEVLLEKDTAKSIVDLLLENNKILSAFRFLGEDNLLEIKCLSDLEKYSNAVIDAFLYGIDYKWDLACVNLPKHYFNVLNDLPYNEQELVLKETFKRKDKIENFESYDFSKISHQCEILKQIKYFQDVLRGGQYDF